MPDPSRLVLLEQLPDLEEGTKARFMACVHAYDELRGRLLLKERYPANTSDAPSAWVDVNGILDVLDHDLVQTGSWINVIGRVAKQTDQARSSRSFKKSKRQPDPPQPCTIVVQASMIWSAGAIHLNNYVSSVEAYQQPCPSFAAT